MQQGIQPRKKALGYLVTFFVIMLILTLLSTTLANISAAQVSVTTPERMALSHKLEAQGVISTGGETILFMDELFVQLGIYVDSISVHEGGEISQGGPILQLNTEQLGTALKEAKNALGRQKLQNNLSNMQAAFTPDPSLQEEAEKKDRETAKRHREEKLQAAEDAVTLAEKNFSDSLEALDNAKSHVLLQQEKAAENAGKAYESRLSEAQAAVEQAQDSLKSAQRSYSLNLLPYRRTTEDCEKAVTAAQEAFDADPLDTGKKDALEDAKKALQRAEEDYSNMATFYDNNISEAKKNLNEAQDKFNGIKNKGTSPFLDPSTAEAAHASAGQAETAAEDCAAALTAAKNEKEKIIADVNDEIWQEEHDSLKKADEARVKLEQEATEAQKKQLELQLQKIELEALEEKVEKLQSISDAGGMVTSQYSGVINGFALQSGSPVTRVIAKVIQGSDILTLTCSVPKSVSQYFKPGDMVTVSFPDSNKDAFQAPIQNIVESPEDTETVNLTVSIAKGKAEAGMNSRLEAENKTKTYDCVIPLDVLKSDSEGDFIFVVHRKEEGWGIKTYAERINVKVLERASNLAAVEGTVGTMDFCVKASNKPVANGDRVRAVV